MEGLMILSYLGKEAFQLRVVWGLLIKSVLRGLLIKGVYLFIYFREAGILATAKK